MLGDCLLSTGCDVSAPFDADSLSDIDPASAVQPAVVAAERYREAASSSSPISDKNDSLQLFGPHVAVE